MSLLLLFAAPPAYQGDATLTGNGSLSAGAAPGATGAAALSGGGSLAAVGVPGPPPAPPTFTSVPGTAGAQPGRLAPGYPVGAAPIPPPPSVSGTAALTGAGSLAVTGVPQATRTVALSGSGTLTAPGQPGAGAAVPLTGSGALTAVGAGTVAATGTAALVQPGHRLRIVIVDVRTGVEHGANRILVSLKVGDEHFDGAVRQPLIGVAIECLRNVPAW